MKAFDFETEYKQTIVGDRFVEKKIEALDEKKAYYFAKRIFDILLSLTGIILSILPSIIIVALIKMTSEGPVFFFQERLGQFGKPFMIIKFRTMMAEAEKDLGPVWAENDDKRTTKIGKVLRKTHLDELPQLINVLKGEMSMVGPRPEREYFYKEFAKYIDGFEQRLLVPPGITGLAQLSGKYDMPPEKKIIYDLHYIEKPSLLRDFVLIIRTALEVIM